ncbi:MAG: MBL fold metallo-hydrolase [Melioribacteraceae bacterium]
MNKQYGGKISEEEKELFSKSKNWDGKKFLNLEETSMSVRLTTIPKLLYRQLFKTEEKRPKENLPIIPFEGDKFLAASEKTKFIWYGHSVLMLRMSGKTIIIDPMFGSNAAPIAPFSINRFSDSTLKIIDDLPKIDAVFISHDHYDHLDLESIEKLIPKTKHFYTALGDARHLISWGVDRSKITEFSWWESQDLEDIKITFTPSRHFSGRGIFDRFTSLWGGWVFNNGKENIYFSGDGGYGKHFKEVGDRLGPFDIGFMECGQYNESWHLIHMYPEETVLAAKDSGVGIAVPVHWGGFPLSLHKWKDPIERFVTATEKEGVNYFTPQLGEIFSIDSHGIKSKSAKWWEKFK